MTPPEPLRPFLDSPATSAILTDFDGTLAPIVPDPTAARPLPGALDVLRQLTERFGLVGVVSGRPISYLVDRLGPDLWLSGLYGLEAMVGGELVELPGADYWRPVVAETTARAARTFGELAEAKGLSLTLHFRTALEREDEIRAWADDAAAATGLHVRAAKASVELHPPVPQDKGTVVEQAAAGMKAVCFLGDDVGDLPAFDALDRLAADEGVHAVRIAVRTEEAPPALVERADLVVEGPDGALDLLRQLLD